MENSSLVKKIEMNQKVCITIARPIAGYSEIIKMKDFVLYEINMCDILNKIVNHIIY